MWKALSRSRLLALKKENEIRIMSSHEYLLILIHFPAWEKMLVYLMHVSLSWANVSMSRSSRILLLWKFSPTELSPRRKANGNKVKHNFREIMHDLMILWSIQTSTLFFWTKPAQLHSKPDADTRFPPWSDTAPRALQERRAAVHCTKVWIDAGVQAVFKLTTSL